MFLKVTKYQNQSPIVSSSIFSDVKMLTTVCDSKNNNSVYIIDDGTGKIYQYDDKWNYLRYYHADWPFFMMPLNSSIGVRIIVI